MPPDSPALQPILSLLDSDDAWDETGLIQKGYKAAGLKRFWFAKMATYMKHSNVKSRSETLCTHSDDKKSDSAFNADGTTAGKNAKKIKLEYPEWNKLQQVIKGMKGYKGLEYCCVLRPDIIKCHVFV